MAEIIDLLSEFLDRAKNNNPDTNFTCDISSLGIEISEFSFNLFTPSVTPNTLISETFENDTAAQSTQTFTHQEVTEDTHQVELTKGVNIGSEVSVKIPFQIATDNLLNIKETVSISTSNKDTQTSKQSRTRTTATNIIIPSKSTVTISMILNEQNYSGAFQANLKLKGRVTFNPIMPPKPNTLFAVIRWEVLRLSKTKTQFVGELFQQTPNEKVSIIARDAISCAIEGKYSGVHGLDIVIKTKQLEITE
jgi:hypothetical protein